MEPEKQENLNIEKFKKSINPTKIKKLITKYNKFLQDNITSRNTAEFRTYLLKLYTQRLGIFLWKIYLDKNTKDINQLPKKEKELFLLFPAYKAIIKASTILLNHKIIILPFPPIKRPKEEIERLKKENPWNEKEDYYTYLNKIENYSEEEIYKILIEKLIQLLGKKDFKKLCRLSKYLSKLPQIKFPEDKNKQEIYKNKYEVFIDQLIDNNILPRWFITLPGVLLKIHKYC